jgi:polar amino acid transport system substrate-binding protein
MNKYIKLFIFFIILSTVNSYSSEVLILGNESMPFNGVRDAENNGMSVEILNEITKFGGPLFKYQLGLQWARAQIMLHNSESKVIAIIPFTRTPERESNYMWITELFTYELRFSASKKSNIPSNIKDAKNLRIGIIRGSAHIPLLTSLGFNNIYEVNNGLNNAMMLANNRIDLVIESSWVDNFFWKQAGYEQDALYIGPTIGETKHIYLAGNTDFSSEVAKEINKAMEIIKKNGRLKELLDKWN